MAAPPITIKMPEGAFAMELRVDDAKSDIVSLKVYPTHRASQTQKDRGCVSWYGNFDLICNQIIKEVLDLRSQN